MDMVCTAMREHLGCVMVCSGHYVDSTEDTSRSLGCVMVWSLTGIHFCDNVMVEDTSYNERKEENIQQDLNLNV